jgi:hypothetical protein
MRPCLKGLAWFVAALLPIGSITGCQQLLSPPPPAFSGGIEYTAYVFEGATGAKSGVIAVQFSANLTQVLGTGHGTTTSINQSTDQTGTVNRPDAQTNATWHASTNWLYSPFASCLGSIYDVNIPAQGGTITETCSL